MLEVMRKAAGLDLLTKKQQVRSQEGLLCFAEAKSLFPSGDEDLKPVHMA